MTSRQQETAPPPSAGGGDDPEILQWIQDARRGDAAAFERLIESHQDRVWRRALYRLGDHDEAADVTQEVLVLCFRKLDQFRGESRFWTWLARIVDNQVKNRRAWLDRRGSGRTFSLDAPPEGAEEDGRGPMEAPDPGPDPRRIAENRESIEALERCLGLLSEDHREVLLMRFSSGLSYEEIAAELELSLGTVKSRINRARAELRTLMAGHLETEEKRTVKPAARTAGDSGEAGEAE